jgi:hypothetical protein
MESAAVSKLIERFRSPLITPARRGAMLAVMASAIAGVTFGWFGTSPWLSMGINWDTAGYSTDIGRGGAWAGYPWNSHYGAWQVYWIATHVARAFGATLLDGVRGLNALALAGSAAMLALCGLRWKLSPVLAVLIAGIYLCSWGTLLLVFTWEDNVLVHPGALAALTVCIFRVGNWRARDSLLAGACIGIASLMSWQGASFALPAIYAAAVLGVPGLAWYRRLANTALVPLGLVAMRAVWVTIYWLTATKLSLLKLFQTAFGRPSPNYLPEHLSGWWVLLGKWREILDHVGIGVTHEAGPSFRDSAALVPYLRFFGILLLAISLLAWLTTNLLFRARFSRGTQFVAAAFFGLTMASAIYLDLPVDKYKRYDYIPMCLSLGCAALAAHIVARKVFLHRTNSILAAALFLLLGGQSLVAYRWNREWYAKFPSPANYAGHGTQTWFAYMRSLKKTHPAACSFMFAFDEVKNGRYQLEIPAALYSELPNPMIVGAPPGAAQWPRPLPLYTGTATQNSLRSCAWASPSAQAVMGRMAP